MTIAILVLNGQACHKLYEFLQDQDNLFHLFATDGAAQKLDHRLHLNGILGDFDSLEQHNSFHDTPKIHLPDQNFTDFEKSLLYLIDNNYTQVILWSGNGGDIDHNIYNLNVMARYHSQLKLTAYTDEQFYCILDSGKYTLHMQKDKIVSFLGFPKATITADCVQYPLNSYKLNLFESNSTRNQSLKSCISLTVLGQMLLSCHYTQNNWPVLNKAS